MTLEQIKTKLLRIKSMRGDSEVAHTLEDGLYAKFVRHVAENGPNDLREMAKEVLKTHKIDFARWHA